MASIKDVAAAADVSVATVSRVLNDHPSVSARARERVLAAVEKLGYRPNAVARSLRTDQTRTLGLVISDVLNPYFTELARSVEVEARLLGYSVIIGNADERPDLQDHHVRTLLDRRIDGLLVSPTDGCSPLMADAARAGTPMVFVDRWIADTDVPVVRSDGRGAVRDLVAHLYGLGHRRLAIIAGPAATTTGRERIEAFREGLAAHGLDLPDVYIGQGDFQADSGRMGHRGVPGPARAARGRVRRRQPDGAGRAGRHTGARAARSGRHRTGRVRRHPVVRAHRSADHRDRPAHGRTGPRSRARAGRPHRGAHP